MAEIKELVKYSSCFYGGPEGQREQVARKVLSELFVYMAQAVLREPDFEIHKCKEIILQIETDSWDQKFILILSQFPSDSGQVPEPVDAGE